MAEQDETPRRDARERPPDPAGTRPRHDPEALLPDTPEPLLPERVRPAGSPAVAAATTEYAPRFHFMMGALVAVAIAAVVGVALAIVQPGGSGGSGDVAGWSSWRPSDGGKTGAQEIADHVAPNYRLPNGKQMVTVEADNLQIEGIPLSVAVRETAQSGGDIRVFDDGGVIYRLCGLGPLCSINQGKPSAQRHLLLRREALELALYTFRYLDGVHQVVVFMPPPPGQRPSEVVFFRKGDVKTELDRPLYSSLSPRVPNVRTVALSPDARLVDQVTSPKLFNYSLTQGNTERRIFVVLDPLTAAQRTPTPKPATSAKKSSSKSSSSSSSKSSARSSSQK